MKLKIILFLMLMWNLVWNMTAQMIGFGTCPPLKGSVQNFDLGKYTGIWFEQYRYFLAPEIGTKCSQANITHSEDGSLEYQMSYYDSWINNYKKLNGIAKIDGPEGVGQYEIDFINRFLMAYQVIDTDYESYAIVSTCVNEDRYYTRNILIFTRHQFPSSDTINTAIKQMKKMKLSTKFLHSIDHALCNKINIDFDPEAEYIDDFDNT